MQNVGSSRAILWSDKPVPASGAVIFLRGIPLEPLWHRESRGPLQISPFISSGMGEVALPAAVSANAAGR